MTSKYDIKYFITEFPDVSWKRGRVLYRIFSLGGELVGVAL